MSKFSNQNLENIVDGQFEEKFLAPGKETGKKRNLVNLHSSLAISMNILA